MQRAFTQMEVREDFLEADDLEVRGQSLRKATNMRALSTRVAESRGGTFFVRELSDALDIVEIKPEVGLKFGLILNDNSMQIVDQYGRLVYTNNSVPWKDASTLWVNPYRKKVVIGSELSGINVLTYSDGNWTFAPFAFLPAPGGELAQPYWAYEQEALITPSADNGTITVTASLPIWTSDYVGLRIRYGSREIEITEFISSTVLRGNVINKLPPSFRITVADASEFRVGEAVVGADTGYQGLIVSISGNQLRIVTLAFFEGPDVAEELSSPSGSSAITVKTSISLEASPVWDEPLMSPVRGYPRSSSNVSGRIVFLDFPQVPDAIALSSSRAIEDFKVGAEDDDAIVRQVGDSAPRWLHAINMGDLILLADNGVYNVPARDNGVISPSTFNTVFIDNVGSSEIEPVKVDDGVVFVEASGEAVSAVVLDGNVYLKWSVRDLTTFHSQLIKSPKRLCGPSLGSTSADKFMFVVNGDGTLAAVSWQQSIRDENVGFAPWETQGTFINVAPIFNGYWAIVDRQVQGGTVRFLERFSDDAFLDCAVESTGASALEFLQVNGSTLEVNGDDLAIRAPVAEHLAGATVAFYSNGWDGGDFVVNPDGTLPDEPVVTGPRQIGLNYEARLMPWPVEVIESERAGTLTARVLQAIISVQNTLGFKARCNNTTSQIEAYKAGDDLDLPPVPRTRVYRFAVYGNRDHPEIEFIKDRPGPFRVLATGQRVQA